MERREHGCSNDPGRTPSWMELESGLVGSSDLGNLIEILAVQALGPSEPECSIGELLGPHLANVLDQGLACLPAEVLDGFVRQPALLRDLQGLIFVAGGDYWKRRIDQTAADLPEPIRVIGERIAQAFERRTHRS